MNFKIILENCFNPQRIEILRKLISNCRYVFNNLHTLTNKTEILCKTLLVMLRIGSEMSKIILEISVIIYSEFDENIFIEGPDFAKCKIFKNTTKQNETRRLINGLMPILSLSLQSFANIKKRFDNNVLSENFYRMKA
ncbi:hypothetical protein RFI_29363 [Reticulomyxa filosa]|uniref:Uncharacterized protein n=1 Tax=Reticulomyxa filosa TaxID=46433 RepID=X6M1K0_RETFI|nr:hypothetical protein RFI_29363 [Reticulomyxa filosa]|eukprot:ETO08028.1 hypothetical protein RFI_29363 [Reticulomyxa filosa]